jgi:hypothetical protein
MDSTVSIANERMPAATPRSSGALWSVACLAAVVWILGAWNASAAAGDFGHSHVASHQVKRAEKSHAVSKNAAIPKASNTLVSVVEYYNANLDHYFITANAAEIATLDGGAFGGAWNRTGHAFGAWALDAVAAGAVPVCRFFGTDEYRADGSRIGPNSHFYTADPAECAFVKTGYRAIAANGISYPAWTYEDDAFAVQLPAGGTCPDGATPLYRAYNDGARGDPNHRYSRDMSLLAATAGWTFEGLVMCLPAPNAIRFDAHGVIRGCDDSGCAPPTVLGSGRGWVDLVVELGNPTGLPIQATLPAGFVMQSESTAFQDGLLLDAISVVVPANGSIRVLLALYCLQLERHEADAGATYRLGAVTNHPALLEIIELPRPRPVVNRSQTARATQLAIWEVTDGAGALTPVQSGLLRQIYATAEDDPALAALMSALIASLTY